MYTKQAMLQTMNKHRVFLISSVFTVAGAMILMAEPITQAYHRSQGLPANQKCEDQLPELIKKMGFPGNGASHYNPWTRQCDYKYFKDGEISIYQWTPVLK